MQVANFIRRKQLTDAERADVPASFAELRQRLNALSAVAGVSQAAAAFIAQLEGVAAACAVLPGRASLSRKTVRAIVMHFCQYMLPLDRGTTAGSACSAGDQVWL